MVKFFTLACVASALSLAAVESKSSHVSLESVLEPRVGHIYNRARPVIEKRTLPGLVTPVVSQLLRPSFTRSPPSLSTGRFSFKQARVHAYLTDALNAILPHTTNIRRLCGEAENAGAQGPDAQKLSWDLVAELRAILDILNGCFQRVKSCGTAPSPSGIPGGKTPTLDDICALFFKIMCEIRQCCKLIGGLCTKYRVVRQVCQDTLKQINTCCSSIAVRCGVEVGDMWRGLGRLFGSIPNFFTGIQFGFSAFPSIVGGGYGSFSLNVGL